MSFNHISPQDIRDNPFTLIGDDWMLVTAAKADGSFNTMTASWGGVGIMWAKPTAVTVIRPQRHTFSFMEEADYFTLTFLKDAPDTRNILQLCGSKSGRDTDKIAETGLRPIQGAHSTVYFEQAKLVLICRKVYAAFLKPDAFTDPELCARLYPANDLHKAFVGKITDVLVSE